MLGLGASEILLVLVVLLLVFGAAKLPKIGQSLGEGVRQFKKGLKGEGEDLEEKEEKKQIGKKEE
ncbi:MAG: twin-arginine translocase TatA/TatE family subunit [Deltaproteobacteria bacterium]|nr:twin-arginine translocase TatA/TatE family subunit [Deltaproteobacteria bacterium]